MASDLDIPPPPRPADCLRSLSRRLNEALLGGGAFDRSGYDARRIVRDAAAEMLTIAAAFEKSGQPAHRDLGNVLIFTGGRGRAAPQAQA